MKIITLSVLLGFLVLPSCISINGYPKVKELGLVNVNTKSLPSISIEGEHNSKLHFRPATTYWKFAYRSKLTVGQKLDLANDGVVSYSLVELTKRSATQKWHFEWRHPKYGTGSKYLNYKGESIYAIRKKDFSIGLIPNNSEQ